MDENPFKRLGSKKFDILIFYDYSNLSFEKIFDFKKYKNIYIIAWSFGVWAYSEVQKSFYFGHSKSIAINGTLMPVDNIYGIPKDVFYGTIKNFSYQNRDKFYKRIFKSPDEFRNFLEIKPSRDIESQFGELQSLKNLIENSIKNFSKFDIVLISDSDRIFPPKNQINFWEEKCRYKIIKGGHFPFFKWSLWEDIIEYFA